jgi:hypothetical protein
MLGFSAAAKASWLNKAIAPKAATINLVFIVTPSCCGCLVLIA